MGKAPIISPPPERTIHPHFLQPGPIHWAAVDRYWAKFLGCSSAQLYRTTGTLICPLPAATGIWALARKNIWVVAAPPLWCDAIGDELRRCFRPHTLPSPRDLQQLLEQFPGQQWYGPGLVFLHDQPVPPPPAAATIRPLAVQDAQAVAAFTAAAAPAPVPWTLDEPDIWIKVWGLFVKEVLVSTCAVRVWGELLAEIYVDTAPAYRCQGYGKVVTAAALEWIRAETPYYAESVVELTNLASIKLLRRLGGKPYGYMAMSFDGAEA